MTGPNDPRSALAIGWEWASRITTVGLTFALPPLMGAGLDRLWGTSPIALLVGAFLGFAVGMAAVLRLAGASSAPRRPPGGRTA